MNNLRKSRKKWARMSRILGVEVADARTSGTFFKVVVQAVIFLGLEMWVVTHHLHQTMEFFHYRVA